MCGTFPGCLAAGGSGSQKKKCESGSSDALGNVVDVVSRPEQIPNGDELHTFPAQWNSLTLLIIHGLLRAAGLTLCLPPHCLLDFSGGKNKQINKQKDIL